MVEGEEWLIRPVNEGYCKYESLIDGTLSLADVAMMNEAIDVRNENSARAMKAAEQKQKQNGR